MSHHSTPTPSLPAPHIATLHHPPLSPAFTPTHLLLLRRPVDLDLAEFLARLPRCPGAVDILLHQWAIPLARRVLQEPSPKLLALDRKYNPDKELRLLARQYHVSPAEMDTLVRT